MAKELHELKTFISGTITTPDAKDIPEDAAQSSLNIDPTSSDGKIIGIGKDTEIDLDGINFSSNTMGIINVGSKRTLIGVDEHNNEIKSIQGLYEEVSYGTHALDSIGESSIVIDDNQAYVGLGGASNSTPKFVGIVKNKPFGLSHDGILVEDAEAKRFADNYYGIRKVATTISADSVSGETPEGNTGTTEDDYIWGLVPGERFLFRIDVNDSNVEGTLTPSNYIKYSNGFNITSKINSIATCISQNNMLWATTNDGHIYRLHVNASTLEVTVQLDILPHFNTITSTNPSSENDTSFSDAWNFNNKPPPSEAELSDIIEVRSPADSDDNIKYDLVMSYWKEDGFLPNESYIYKKSISPWVETETVNTESLVDPFSDIILDTSDDVITQYYLQNVLFKDISILFSVCETFTTNCVGFGEVEVAMRTDEDNYKISRLTTKYGPTRPSFGLTYDGYEPDWDDVWNPLVPFDELYTMYKKLKFSSRKYYDHETDDEGVSMPIYDSVGTNKSIEGGTNSIVPPPDEHLFHRDGYRYDLGRNIGFLGEFKLHVHKFGLIALENNSDDDNIKNDVYVGLFAHSDKSFITNAGTLRGIKFLGRVDDPFGDDIATDYAGFFGEIAHEKVNLNNGFFITINSSKKVHPRIAHTISNTSIDNGVSLSGRDSMAVGSITSENLIADTSEVLGTSLIARLSTNDDTEDDGGYSDLLPANIESIGMDRFGNRAAGTFTTSSNYKTPNNYENLCFLAESKDENANDHFDSTKFWSVDFDTLTLLGGNTYTDLGGNSKGSGVDVIHQGLQADGDYMQSKLENNIGGACIFPIFDSATTVGGDASPHTAIWYFSLYSTDTNNYSNGVLPLVDASDYNDWGTLREDVTTYSLMTFVDTTGTAGDNQFQEDAQFAYKIALVYDNGAVSKLTKQEWKHTDNSDFLKSVKVTIKLSAESLSKRVTAIQLYRRGGTSEGASFGDFHLAVNQIQLSSGWTPIENSNGDVIYYQISVVDYNLNLGSYENMAALVSEEVVEHTLPNYSLSTIVNNANVIGKCFVPNHDDYTNYLFKSNAGRYNQFDIATETNWLKLPTTPTAIKGFAGRLFAFDENNTYIINTTSMLIEDELEGVGCLGKSSVITTEFGMFFADDSNIYMYDGQKTIPIANSILKSNDNFGWLQRRKDFNPIVGFDGSKLSLVVMYRTSHNLTDEEVNAYVEEILFGGNPDNLTVFDIIDGLDKYYAWVYNLRLKRWDRWELPNGAPLSVVSGKDGELIISTTGSLVFYGTNLEDRRNWEWLSKDITLAEDGKYKKFYSIVSTSNSSSNSFIEYKVDGKEFKPLTENDLISSEDRKAKNINIKLTSSDDDLEVDSLSLSYRRLTNSSKNV